MPDYDVSSRGQDTWTRGQIFRATIIFIEIAVLLTVVFFYTMQKSDAPVASDTVVLSEVVVNADMDIQVPTTANVDSFEQDGDSSSLEDLIGEAQRYDDEFGMGCPNGGH